MINNETSLGHDSTRAEVDNLPSTTEAGVVNRLDSPLIARINGNIPNHLSRVVVERVQHDLIRQRDEILKLPSDEKGLDMDRIHAYRESIGAPYKHLRVLSPHDYQQAVTIANERSAGRLNRGKYLYKHDIIIVKRDPLEEQLNGPGITESFAVHEIAHSSSLFSNFQIAADYKRGFLRRDRLRINAPALARTGFVVCNTDGVASGYFLEEGYAEYERGQYVANVLGRPEGLAHNPEVKQFAKYTFNETADGECREGMCEGSGPAVVLEVIIQRDPEFLSMLRAARHSASGLSRVIQHLNRVSPSLYRYMRGVDIKSEDAGARIGEAMVKIYKSE